MRGDVPGGTKGLAERYHVDTDGEEERKEVRSGIAGEGQQLYEEDELKIVEKSEGDKNKHVIELIQTQAQIHRPHSQSQPRPHVVRWEKFLPLRSLRVLLVENDDSTRHVVSALLRNCSYQVTPVSNGLEAWKILIDLNNQIDLVLTEVVMPGVSGISLLSKIMSHKSCQNIPVIMMSSHDSMGIVLKCLSTGAADFLVKPIRKNELKNLWQHVWRRCHSSGGGASESGIPTETSGGAKNIEGLNNDTGNNGDDDDDEDGNADDTRSVDLLARDGSDDGSGTQSSWTKRVPEAESPPDSTFARVIYPRSEAFASSWFPSPMKNGGGQDIQHDDIAMGKDLEIGIPRNSDSLIKVPRKTVATSTSAEKNQSSQLDLKIDGRNVDNDEHRGGMGSKMPTILLEVFKSKDKVTENCKDLPSLELSLKRMGDVANTLTNAPQQNILGHSEISAFTRYNTGSTANQGQTGNVGSCSPPGNSSEAMKQSNFRYPPNQTSNSSTNNNDMGSTTDRSFTKPAFQPPQLMASGNDGGGSVNVVPSQESEMGQVHNHHRYHHHHHRHILDDLSLENTDGSAPQCGSSNNERVVNETNAASCSLNGSAGGSNHGSNLHNGSSAGGSNHGSNLHNGSSAAVNAELMNMVSDNNGAAMKEGVDKGSVSESGIRVVDQNRSAQRAAALNKFRLKRKERCFDKRVRYQSRKKLAEQRPRVRGQFVRQVREIGGMDEDS